MIQKFTSAPAAEDDLSTTLALALFPELCYLSQRLHSELMEMACFNCKHYLSCILTDYLPAHLSSILLQVREQQWSIRYCRMTMQTL